MHDFLHNNLKIFESFYYNPLNLNFNENFNIYIEPKKRDINLIEFKLQKKVENHLLLENQNKEIENLRFLLLEKDILENNVELLEVFEKKTTQRNLIPKYILNNRIDQENEKKKKKKNI